MHDDDDALRRRYGPDAGRELEDADVDDGEPLLPGRRRRIRVVALVLAIVLLLGAAGVGFGTLTLHLGAGPVAPGPVRTDAVDRQDFEDSLARGGAAGIAAWLVTHPSPRDLASATRFVTTEGHGTGDGTVRVPAAAGTSRATVLVVTGSDADLRWSLDGGSGRPAVRGGRQTAGSLTAATVAVREGALGLRVSVPAGVAWGAAVVLSD